MIEDGTLIWTVNGTVCGAPEEAVATGVTPEELPELPGVLVAAGLLLDEDEGEGVEVPVAPLFPTVTGFVVSLFPIPLLFTLTKSSPPYQAYCYCHCSRLPDA